MRVLNKEGAGALLRSQGVADSKALEEILKGFDFDKPAYEQDFWPGDVLYQLIRMPSAKYPVIVPGNWFGIAGITTQNVAINDGLSGRNLVRYEVLAPFKALEGTAKELPVDIGTGVGGAGGGTQIFLPSILLGHLRSLGPAPRWSAQHPRA